MELPIELKLLHPAAVAPEPATALSAGVDLRMLRNSDQPLRILPGETQLVGTGLAININQPGWCAVILPRSGLGSKGLVLGNLVGLIDADYQGELKVCLWNRGKDEFTLMNGDRIAQLVFLPVGVPAFTVVEEFAASERGEGGFGSTSIS